MLQSRQPLPSPFFPPHHRNHRLTAFVQDGYEYARTKNRYWRKNRAKNSDGTYGVDQNRNWDANWGESGSSHTPSSDVYCGPSVFSEPETKAMKELVQSFGTNGVAAVIDFHSNGQLLLRPWAYQSGKCKDDSRLQQQGAQMVKLIQSVYGKAYKNIRASELYIASGAANDGLYILGIPTSYTYELAGDDFVVPESDIQTQGQEIFESLKYFFAQALL